MKVILKFCFICALLVSLIKDAGAQTGTITGKVLSHNTPLPYVTVQLSGTSIGTTSDEEGKFRIEEVETGSFALETSFVGLKPVIIEGTLESDQELILNIHMDRAVSLEEIVVSGTMKPTYVSDSPIKIDVITARQLDNFIPSAASSVVEGIQLVNGVQEVIACGVCFTNSISINGLPGAYTAILMDGTPMYGNLASVYGLNGIPNMIIDRFEVIKGPSSTLYGSEAVAGVINIITKDPEDQPQLSIDIMGTSHREAFGNMAIAPSLGKTHGYIGLNFAYINDFDDQNNDGFGDNINLDRYSLFTKWDIHRKSNNQFNIAAKYYYEDRRNGVEAFLNNRAYRMIRGSDSIYGESIYTRRFELFGTYEIAQSPFMKLDFSLSQHDQDSFYGSADYQASQQIAFANLVYNKTFLHHDIVGGLSSRFNGYDDNTVATREILVNGEIKNKADRQFIPGIFVQDEISAGVHWTLLSGLRVDHYPAHGFILSPRLNVKFKPDQWTTLRTNFGTGFRTVHLFTEDHAFLSGQRSVEIIEQLQPERSLNVAFNMNHVFSLAGGAGSIDLESYFTHFSNKISPNYNTPGKIIYQNSTGYARTMGIGVNMNYTFSFPLGMNLSYNRQRATETDVDPLNNKTIRNLEFAPEWSGLISINYQWKAAGTSIAYTARFTGPMTLPEVFDLDENGQLVTHARSTISESFSIHNIQITHDFHSLFSVYAGIQNALDFRQTISPLIGYNDPNTAPGFSPYFDTSYAYAPNHGREFYLGIKWSLGK